MQHTAISLLKMSWVPSNSWNLYSSHIEPLDLTCCHCRRSSYLRGIRFLKLWPVKEKSLNKRDDCRHSEMATKKIKRQEKVISEILVADTDSESGAEASDVEDDFEERR